MFSPAQSISGATDQVQRNLIGERVLGLPKEPSPDRGTPFREPAAEPDGAMTAPDTMPDR